ncbi:filamentous haemagglutinin family protein, partial [Ideonella livida]
AAGAGLQRTGATARTGQLDLGDAVALQADGGTLVLDSSGAAHLGQSPRWQAADITLAGGRLALGADGGAGALQLQAETLAALSRAEAITLRAYDRLVLGEATSLGRAGLAELRLDTPNLDVSAATGAAGATVRAQQVTLQNSTGATAAAGRGAGRLTVRTSAGALTLAEGAVAVQGAQQVVLDLSGALALAGSGSLSTGGDLKVLTPGVQATVAGVSQALQAGGDLSLLAGAGSALDPDAAAVGATLALQAGGTLVADTRITLPAGQLSATAQDHLRLGAQARLDLAGRTLSPGGVDVPLDGGTARLVSQQGAVLLEAGSRLDVSAADGGATGAQGGTLQLQASAGRLQLDGTLAGQGGATLQLDSLGTVDLDGLARAQQAAVAAGQGLDFGGALQVRQRGGGGLSLSAGHTLAARDIDLAADHGALDVAGTLDARGVEGGRVSLSASGAVRLADGAQVLAGATQAQGAGGQLFIRSLRSARLDEAGALQDAGITLAAGSRVDLQAGAQSTQTGRLTLQALRLTEAGTGRTEVAIDPLAGTLAGVGRLDVEGLKRYDAAGTLAGPASGLQATVVREASAFIDGDGGTASGAGARGIAQRLSAGQDGLAGRVQVHAGAELRASGDLSLTGPWSLASDAQRVRFAGGDASTVGDLSLTVRSAGHLQVKASVQAGQGASPLASGGSLRFIAGADLESASLLGLGATGAGDLSLGTARSVTTVSTSVGELVLAAAGDVQLTAGDVRAYTTGVSTTDAQALAVRRAGVAQDSAFFLDAGDVRVRAGGSVRGKSVSRIEGNAYAAHPNEWSSSGQFTGSDGLATTWWSAGTAHFQHGLGTFGGGQIQVSAGQDIVNLVAAAPGSGYFGADGVAHRWGGGSVRWQAGRDVVNGVVQAGGAALTVRAGRDIAFQTQAGLGPGDDQHALVLAHADTAVHLGARRDLTVGSLQSTYALDGRWLAGLDTQATLNAVATAGDLVWRTDKETEHGLDGEFFAAPLMLLPGQVRLAAPSGDLSLAGPWGIGSLVQQAQQADTRLDLVAGQDLRLQDGLQVNAARLSGGLAWFHADGGLGSAEAELLPGTLRRSDGARLDASDRDPVRLVAAQGDLVLANGLRSARPLTLQAGRDLRLDSDVALIDVQHQPAGEGGAAELTLLQAGRDLQFGLGGLLVGGPGDVVLLAGRHLDLGQGSGLVSNGNNDNGLLAAQGARLTLVAGLAATDLQAALDQGAHLLGTGLGDHAADLYALLSDPAGPVLLGSATAEAFEALPLWQKVTRVQALLGDSAWQEAVVRYVRALPDHAADTPAQALAAWSGLSDPLREDLLGRALARQLGRQAADRRGEILGALARAEAEVTTTSTGEALVAWMATHEGRTGLSLEQARSAFEALPRARQVLWLQQVLVGEVRSAGRAAVQAGDAGARATAYAQAYQALDLLFPQDTAADAAARPGGDIRLPQSTVRTLQGGDIVLLAPGGGVNAGETGSSLKGANELGLVTVAGGGISALVRDDFLVNQSRVFTLAQGDVLLWSSQGDIDAGRGAKTVVGAPAPVYRLDPNTGRIVVDTSGAFSGSGIAVLNAASTLDLYAPAGAIDAGEAGIRSSGQVVLGAVTVRGADDIKGGSVQGAPVAAPAVPLTAAQPLASSTAAGATSEDEDERRRRRQRRALLLEFLGFGRA